MRKREIEKLLLRAVAEALGVELKPSAHRVIETRKAPQDQRAAA